MIRYALVLFSLSLSVAHAMSQDVPGDVSAKIDDLISRAYQAADGRFPCKIGGHGKPKMLPWQEVDRCLNGAAARVDWDTFAQEFELLRKSQRISATTLSAAIEASLTAHAELFEKVFAVKDQTVLVPLTNSLLKFLAPDALQDVPVFARGGEKIGTFSGVYTFERTGGMAMANTYKLTLFQYTDSKDQMQSAPDKLLLDSFGVPWINAKSHRGFRLQSDKLLPPR